MEKELVKRKVCEEIDRHADELIELGQELWRHPEPGYEEFRTARKIESFFTRLSLPMKSGLARTGIRADLATGREGPTLAVLGEMDALVMPDHPEADPDNHSAHGCGHNMQPCALVGAAIGLAMPEVCAALSGNIAFIACPAEEGRLDSLKEGIRFVAGKTELIFHGVFDDVDLAIMTHASADYGIAQTSNGLIMKRVVFRGKAGHAGRPWEGRNALSAARAALAAVDSQRDLFREADAVRIHGIVKNGGDVVNCVPDRVELEYMIRAQTSEAILQAARIFDRSMRGAALSFGLGVELHTIPGYMPLYNEPELAALHLKNLRSMRPGVEFVDFGRRTSSTDLGDVSMIMPAIHPYSGAWHGEAHTVEFHWTDATEAFVEPAKVLAMDAVDLLFDDASEARRIARIKPRFTRDEYRKRVESFYSDETFSGEMEKG